MYTRAQAEEILRNPQASEDELSDLVYSYMDLHKQIAIHPNVSRGFLEWMKAITTDQSVIKIIDGRLEEKAYNSDEAKLSAEAPYAPLLPAEASVLADKTDKPDIVPFKSRPAETSNNEIRLRPERVHKPHVKMGKVMLIVGVCVLIGAYLLMAAVMHLSYGHDYDDEESQPAKSRIHTSNGPTEKLTKEQLKNEKVTNGPLKFEDGKPVSFTVYDAVQIDPYSSLISIKDVLYRIDGNTLKTVKLGCGKCMIDAVAYGSVVGYNEDTEKSFIWNFNINKQVYIPGRSAYIIPVSTNTYVLADYDVNRGFLYDSSGAKLANYPITDAVDLKHRIGDWAEKRNTDIHENKTEFLNLKTAKTVTINADTIEFAKDGLLVRENVDDPFELYDSNMKPTGKKLPGACVYYTPIGQPTIKTILDAVQKLAPQLPSKAQCGAENFQKIWITGTGKVIIVNNKVHLNSINGPVVKSGEGDKDLSAEMGYDSVHANDNVFSIAYDGKIYVYSSDSPKPLLVTKGDINGSFPQLNYLLVKRDDKFLEIYK